jgi:hypothetical protein
MGRDEVALAFMSAWVGRYGLNADLRNIDSEELAKKAYEVADAMHVEAKSSYARMVEPGRQQLGCPPRQ